jgi:hypothetical protein
MLLRNSDGTVVHLSPSRILQIDETRHAFGQIKGSTWPQYRISSPVIEDGVDEEDVPWIRTRSRVYVVEGQDGVLPKFADDQLAEFLAAWGVPQEEWPEIFAQIGLRVGD